MINFKRDDYVEITIRGKVQNVRKGKEFCIRSGEKESLVNFFNFDDLDIDVEVINRAPEQFGPGDVIKHFKNHRVYTILSDEAVFAHSEGRVISNCPEVTNSRYYERVARVTS